jgi:uncharacterized DUF497 family protein/predicted DNA binding CopG/RHH family protein
MNYEWDEAKSRNNVAKHGLNFEDAEQVFAGPCIAFEDDRFAYGEERLITLGLLAGRLVVIAHAPRDGGTRIISMRKRGTDVNRKSVVIKKASDLARIDRMKDSDIDYSEIPRLDKTFLTKATMPWPPAKKQLTIRLDEDVLDWLKRHGKGYQTRINRILRVVMESQPPRTAHR